MSIRYIQKIDLDLKGNIEHEGFINLDPTPDCDVKIDRLVLACSEKNIEIDLKIFDNDGNILYACTDKNKLEALGKLLVVRIAAKYKIIIRVSADTGALLIISGKRVQDGGTTSNR